MVKRIGELLFKAVLVLKYRDRIELGDISFRRNFLLRVPESGAHLRIGDGCFFNNDCTVCCRERIDIGKNCLFGEGVKIYDHNHRLDTSGSVSRDSFDTAPISIGDNCWLGNGVVILKGVTIGGGCVIGAGAVLTKDVPAHSIVIAQHNILIKEIRHEIS